MATVLKQGEAMEGPAYSFDPWEIRWQFRHLPIETFAASPGSTWCCLRIGKQPALPSESRDKPAGTIDSYLKSANSWLTEKKDVAERLLKNTAKSENMKVFFGSFDAKMKGPGAKKPEWVWAQPLFCIPSQPPKQWLAGAGWLKRTWFTLVIFVSFPFPLAVLCLTRTWSTDLLLAPLASPNRCSCWNYCATPRPPLQAKKGEGGQDIPDQN